MQKSSAGGNNFDDAREQGGRDFVIGDADNVQKTSYVVGEGTNPDAPDPAGYNASVRTGSGINFGLVAVAVVAILLALVYGFGIFS
jgi:hypothetical protein